MFDQILVPLDGSLLAEAAMPYALALGRGLDSQLLLLQARPSLQLSQATPIEAQRNEAVAYLMGFQRQATSHGVVCRVKGALGDPAEAILDTVRSDGCDLIVMSTHGRSGLTRWALGGVADKVLHAAPVPVLLIRPLAGADSQPKHPALKRVLVPLDGSTLAEAAVPAASHVAGSLGLELLLVQVVDPSLVSLATLGNDISHEDVVANSDRASRSYLEQVASKVGLAGLPIETESVHGLPAERISDLAKYTPGTLIVMSTHGRSGLTRWALGSVTEKVVRDSTAPVLVVQGRTAPRIDMFEGAATKRAGTENRRVGAAR